MDYLGLFYKVYTIFRVPDPTVVTGGMIITEYTYDADQNITGQKTYVDESKAVKDERLSTKAARFTQEDTYRGDGLNLYAFCAMNPVTYVDPSGYERAPKPYRATYGMGDTISAINDAKSGINVSPSPNNSFVMLKGENDASVNALLNEHGLAGIWYRNNKPDFTPVSMFNVQVDNMPTYREGAGGFL